MIDVFDLSCLYLARVGEVVVNSNNEQGVNYFEYPFVIVEKFSYRDYCESVLFDKKYYSMNDNLKSGDFCYNELIPLTLDNKSWNGKKYITKRVIWKINEKLFEISENNQKCNLKKIFELYDKAKTLKLIEIESMLMTIISDYIYNLVIITDMENYGIVPDKTFKEFLEKCYLKIVSLEDEIENSLNSNLKILRKI